MDHASRLGSHTLTLQCRTRSFPNWGTKGKTAIAWRLAISPLTMVVALKQENARKSISSMHVATREAAKFEVALWKRGTG